MAKDSPDTQIELLVENNFLPYTRVLNYVRKIKESVQHLQ